MASVLIVASEPAVGDLMALVLAHAGYQTSVADTAARAAEQVRDSHPDVVLLDAVLPDEPGMALLRRWREDEATSALAVVMLVAPSGATDPVCHTGAGADDHITKPVAMNDLLARVQDLLHRARAQTVTLPTSAGALQVDFDNRKVKLGSVGVRLNPTELKLLRQLMIDPQCVHSRRQLLEAIWGSSAGVEERSVDVCVKRLRGTFAKAGCPNLIETVRGQGYRLASP